MEKEDTNHFVGRALAAHSVNHYSSPLDAYGAKITDSKFINIENEAKGTKILNNKVLFFYDSGDNKINVIKVKKEKSSYSEHKAKIIDFTLPPKSTMEVFSLDETNTCHRWCYKFKDELQTGTVNVLQFGKPMQHLVSNNDATRRILASWSSQNLIFTYFYVRDNKTMVYPFYVDTEEFKSNPVSTSVFRNESGYKIDEVKEFVFSANNLYGIILHDKNMLTIVDFHQTAITHQVQLDDFAEEIQQIYFKDFNDAEYGGSLDSNSRPMGTLILTAENNTVLYTADMYNQFNTLKLIKNSQLSFKKDKTPKISKFLEGSNMLFLINQSVPYKLYMVKIESARESVDRSSSSGTIGQLQEGASINTRFEFVYETSLSFTEKLNNPIDFD